MRMYQRGYRRGVDANSRAVKLVVDVRLGQFLVGKVPSGDKPRLSQLDISESTSSSERTSCPSTHSTRCPARALRRESTHGAHK
jgi:hypothetical protein